MAKQQTADALRQAENNIVIEGILAEKDLKVSIKDGTEAIIGTLTIETAPSSIHVVNVYCNKMKKNGEGETPAYAGLTTVMNEYKSIAMVGKEEADKVRITMGQISLNDFISQDNLKSYVRYSTNYINRLRVGEEFNPRAEFIVEMAVDKKVREVKNGEETNRLKLTGIVPLFNGTVIPLDFVVVGEPAINVIEDNFNIGDTVKIWGSIVNTATSTVTEKTGLLGNVKKEVKTTYVREMVMEDGDKVAEGSEFDVALIRKAMAERQVYLDTLKNKKSEGDTSGAKKGFTVNKENTPKKNLPF